MAEKTTVQAERLDVTDELRRPRLLAFLFADWANETSDGKANLTGVFDRIYVSASDGEPRPTPPFFVFVRLAQVHEGPVTIEVFAPDGEKTGELGFGVSDDGVAGSDEPRYLQLLTRLAFEVAVPGIYWFNVRYQGQSLGKAPLLVEFRETERNALHDHAA